MSFNKTIILGNLTRDPELKTLPGGATVCEFGVAMNEKRGDADHAIFVEVKAWNKTAETIARYFHRGKQILIEGRLNYESWETNEGQKRSKLSVTCDRFSFVGSMNDNDNAGETNAQRATGVPSDRPQGATPNPPDTLATGQVLRSEAEKLQDLKEIQQRHMAKILAEQRRKEPATADNRRVVRDGNNDNEDDDDVPF